MKDIFYGSIAKTNEEYRNILIRKNKFLIGLIILGIFTTVIAFAGEFWIGSPISDYMTGVYGGIGIGFIVMGILLLIKHKRIMTNEQLLKESRLLNSDERNIEISKNAFRTATFIMLVAMYVVALIGGLYYPILTKVLLFLVSFLLIIYVVTFKYYSKKM